MDLSNVMNLSCIHFDIDLRDKNSIFDFLSDCFQKNGIIKSKTQYLQAVFLREQQSETGLSEGIAIPHGVSPTVTHEAIAYVRLKKPIPWESIDGKPIRHVFLLAIPVKSDKKHIQLLSTLARSLIREDTIKRLNQAQEPIELLHILSERREEA